MRKRKASAYYEIIIKTLVFITLIATAISFLWGFYHISKPKLRDSKSNAGN